MKPDALLDQVRSGMRVDASNGKRIGKIRQVHQRETEVYLEVRSERSLWMELSGRQLGLLFLPPDTVGAVAEGYVTLTVDPKTAKGYTYRPRWIPEKIDDPM
jgi:hypothetical protein